MPRNRTVPTQARNLAPQLGVDDDKVRDIVKNLGIYQPSQELEGMIRVVGNLTEGMVSEDELTDAIEVVEGSISELENNLSGDSGAAKIGFSRTPLSLALNNLDTLYAVSNTRKLNISEYSTYAVKLGLLPTSWDWTPALTAALNDIYSKYNDYTLELLPIRMLLAGSDGIKVDLSYCSIDGNGGELYAPNLSAGNAAVTITRNNGEADQSQFALSRYYIQNLVIRGSGLPPDNSDPSTLAVGLRWDSAVNGTSVRFSTHNMAIYDCGIGEQFLNRSYLIHHYKTGISNCGICVDMPAAQSDYGENIAYFGGVFSGGKFADVRNVLSDFSFYSVSLDYPKWPNVNHLARFDGVVNFYCCHLEIGNEFNPLMGLDHIFHVGNAAGVFLWDGGWITTGSWQNVNINYFVAQSEFSSVTIRNAYMAGIFPVIAMSNRPTYYKQLDIKLTRDNPGVSYRASNNLYQSITAAGGSSLAGAYWYDGTANQRVTLALASGNIEASLTTISDAVGRGYRLLFPIPRGAAGMDVEFTSFSRAATAGTSVVTVEGSYVMLDKSKTINSSTVIARKTSVFTLAAQNLNTAPISRTLPNNGRASPQGMNIPDYAEYFMLDFSLYGSSEPTLGTPAKFTLSGLKVHSY